MQRHNQRAFTLIELLITLVVLAVVMGIAIPSFNQQVRSNQSLALGEELLTALSFARSEAVKRGRLVTLCASNDDASSCSNDSDDWANGWLVVADGAASETAAAPVVDEVIRAWESPQDTANISVSQGGAASFLRYTSLGALARVSNNPARLSAYYTGCTSDAQRQITVGLAGSASVSRIDCP